MSDRQMSDSQMSSRQIFEQTDVKCQTGRCDMKVVLIYLLSLMFLAS